MAEAADLYRTIAAPAQSIYKEKGSKFLGFAFPVESEEEIKEILGQLRKEYYNARHHCYAYMLGAAGATYRTNDDGEPNHSAGDPILWQIRSAGISYILIVVVRYFGGIKLGVSGLIQAYKTAAAEAIAQATIIEKVETATLQVNFTYEHLNVIMSLVKEYKLDIKEQDFSAGCRLLLRVRKSLVSVITGKLTGLATFESI
jgi:uncharacterized YigZ family protein